MALIYRKILVNDVKWTFVKLKPICKACPTIYTLFSEQITKGACLVALNINDDNRHLFTLKQMF